MESNPVPPVLYDVHAGVGRIVLNRVDASNALDMAMSVALQEAVDAAARDEAVRVVLLTGRGELFCVGGDVTAMAAAEDRAAHLQRLADAAHGTVRALDRLDKPVVAGVQGAAAGAGLAFTLSADLVVAGESARFVAAYTAIGLTPDCGLSWLLPRTVGLRRALEMTISNRRISAAEAVDWGLATSTCPDDSVGDVATALAEKLAAGPATAYGRSRSLLRSASTRSLDAQLDLEAATISAAGATAEATALIDSFVDGRR
jgi:2-(1,2-epoxy-1,2-dihydrophenyl)acetyl-CoA isomerase